MGRLTGLRFVTVSVFSSLDQGGVGSYQGAHCYERVRHATFGRFEWNIQLLGIG